MFGQYIKIGTPRMGNYSQYSGSTFHILWKWNLPYKEVLQRFTLFCYLWKGTINTLLGTMNKNWESKIGNQAFRRGGGTQIIIKYFATNLTNHLRFWHLSIHN